MGTLTDAFSTAGVRLVYLPKYCPELNPIELGFGILKGSLRTSQILSLGGDGKEAIFNAAQESFSARHMRMCYRRCGYSMGPEDDI